MAKIVAIAGGTGHFGLHITHACLKTSFREVRVLSRNKNDDATKNLEADGAKIFQVSYDDISSIKSALKNVDVVISALGTQMFEEKTNVLKAAAESNVSVYFPAEFGIDERLNDFSNAVWDKKKEHQENARHSIKKVCAVYIPFFTEDSFGKWFGIFTKKDTWEIIGSKHIKASFTSLHDGGNAVAALASLPIEDIPDHVYIAGDTVSVEEAAKQFSSVSGQNINIIEHPLEAFKKKILVDGKDKTDPSQFLRLLWGEGKMDYSSKNGNELINPGESKWKWKTIKEYAKEVNGKPWWDHVESDSKKS
ncbi:unnamed protein product [Didymodactylos carnosus]|uniref:NmrA-like domain-containing protein n=2 Tax=Didymodactylos carnosus TaxID=1234261 RepID=A0A8S2E8E3_9BILA|nr:unnamed protein product [Didymodactylos carnosus]CAF3962953.1 unnamed protein product [Didymodactylos carnosus]